MKIDWKLAAFVSWSGEPYKGALILLGKLSPLYHHVPSFVQLYNNVISENAKCIFLKLFISSRREVFIRKVSSPRRLSALGEWNFSTVEHCSTFYHENILDYLLCCWHVSSVNAQPLFAPSLSAPATNTNREDSEVICGKQRVKNCHDK